MALTKSLKPGAGRRSKYIEIQQASSKEAAGSFAKEPDYTHLCYRFAEEAMSSGRETQLAFQTYGILQGIFKIRFDNTTKNITERDRLVVIESGRILQLAAPPINEFGNNETLILYCVETPSYTPPQ